MKRGRGRAGIFVAVLGWCAAALPVLPCGPDPAAPAAPSPAAGHEVLARARARLIGGVAELRSTSQRATIEVRMGEQALTIDQRIDVLLPDRIRRTLVVDDREQVVVIAGERGYLGNEGQRVALPPERLREAVQQLGRDLLVLVAGAGEPDLEVRGSGRLESAEAACDRIDVSLHGVESSLCVDDRGEVLSQSFQGVHPMTGAAGWIEIRFSDYREAEGVRYPYRHLIHFDGEPMVTVTVEQIRVNPELEAGAFDVPPDEE